MSVRYCCSHLEDPQASLPPSYPSSSSSHHPLPSLYFCEECDAIRCNLCVGVEIASYFCPNCLFDVPSASVRADRNRNCFSCPRCESSLAVQATEQKSEDGSIEAGAPYILACGACRWTSREIGWEFEKPTGLAAQLQKINTRPETIQNEFDNLKDHLESYITATAPMPTPRAGKGTKPSRHISHLTQMAAKALGRDVPGMMGRSKRKDGQGLDKGKEKAGWDELEVYKTERSCKGLSGDLEEDERAGLEVVWSRSWADEGHGLAKTVLPERIRLQTKLTKRCPESNCRHLLIQPDTKSTRFKIKMVAMSYLPAIELGRRRHRISLDQPGPADSPEELEKRRRERRKTRIPAKEEDEAMIKPLRAGEIYTFQLAFINPLFDPIQIRLTPSTQRDSRATCSVFVPVPHFTVNALKDAWAYDEEEEDDHGSEGHSEEGSSTFSGPTKSSASGPATLGKKSRLSVLGGLGDKRKRDHGVERKGNISKVGVEVEILPETLGLIEADMEVRFTYRADEAVEGEEKGKEGYKTFTFWIRVAFGTVERT